MSFPRQWVGFYDGGREFLICPWYHLQAIFGLCPHLSHLMDTSTLNRSQLKPLSGEPVKIFDGTLFKGKVWHLLINKWKLTWIQFDVCHLLQNYDYSPFLKKKKTTIFKQNAFGPWQIFSLGDLCNFTVLMGNHSKHFSTQGSWFEEAAELLVDITERAPSSTQHLWTEMALCLPIGKKEWAFSQSPQLQIMATSTWLQLTSTKQLLASFCHGQGSPAGGGILVCGAIGKGDMSGGTPSVSTRVPSPRH